jgi:flavin reductase (DIM6/NTAB) family NADH-FMN oxidoreductase RutF
MFAQPPAFGPGSPLYRPPDHYLRGCLGRFATGVAVVTFAPAGGEPPHGITVNSFTSVSMDPPLILVSLQRSSNSHDMMRGRPFTVNILGAEQQALALHFAGRPSKEPAWIDGTHAPRLAGTISYIECTPWAEYDGGDHTLFLGEVRHFDYRNGDALGFVNGQFSVIPELDTGHEALL